jgi:putative membrane protein
MNILLHLAVLTLTVLALARLLPGVHIRSMGSAIVVAIVFSLLDFFLGWLPRS